MMAASTKAINVLVTLMWIVYCKFMAMEGVARPVLLDELFQEHMRFRFDPARPSHSPDSRLRETKALV